MSRDRVRAPEPAPPSALFAPFQALRAPDLQLVGSHALPDRWTVFALVMAGYFLIMSGVVYDVLHEPDSMGVVTVRRRQAARSQSSRCPDRAEPRTSSLSPCKPPPRLAGWLAGWMAGWLDGWMAGWLDGWMDGWKDGWMDGWIAGKRVITEFNWLCLPL
jgi:hypothetical protein